MFWGYISQTANTIGMKTQVSERSMINIDVGDADENPERKQDQDIEVEHALILQTAAATRLETREVPIAHSDLGSHFASNIFIQKVD